MAGFCLSGLASPLTIVPPYRELEKFLGVYKNKRFEPERVQDIVSAIYNTTYALGGIIGPLFGYYMTYFTDFRTTADIQGLIMIAVASIQFFSFYLPSLLRKNKHSDKEDDE